MAEFQSLQESLDAVQKDLKVQDQHRQAQNTLLAEQNKALKAMQEKLPSFATRWHLRLAILAVVLVFVLAGYAGWQFRARDQREGRERDRRQVERQLDQEAAARASDEAIVINACTLKGLLEQAASSSARNPIPPGLDPVARAFVERSRADAQAFYEQQLAAINVTLGRLGNPACPSPSGTPGG